MNEFAPGPGPYDFDEVEPVGSFIDFGHLLLPTPPADLKVSLECEETSGKGMAVTLEASDFVLQVSVFSATKSGGEWNEVMQQLEQSIAAQGGLTRRDHSGIGITLYVATPTVNEDASTSVREMRVLGFEGNRWLLRGILTGAAVNDLVVATEAEALFRSWIVRRGDEPLPPLELLELSRPPQTPPPLRNF
jgi:hypothetical protein